MNQAYARGNENYFLVSAVSNKRPYVNEAVTLAVRFTIPANLRCTVPKARRL